VARLAPLEYQELLLTLEEEARLKILAQDQTTSSRPNTSAGPRSLSLASPKSKVQPENLWALKQKAKLLLPVQSLSPE
jgi:hypothetical protein